MLEKAAQPAASKTIDRFPYRTRPICRDGRSDTLIGWGAM
jgi:hypothetical protein